MPHIRKAKVKEIRTKIRAEFPTSDGWKWSVQGMNDNVGVVVALLQYPKGYLFPGNLVLDHHNPEASCSHQGLHGKEQEVMAKAGEILMADWWVESENTNMPFYPSLRIGTWDIAAIEAE